MVTLEDFNDVITEVDKGFNDFAGGNGELNKEGQPYGVSLLNCSNDMPPCSLHFSWDFLGIPGLDDPAAFSGLFFSLFGLKETVVTYDGTVTQVITFPEHALDLDRVDGVLNEPGGPRGFRNLCVELASFAVQDVKLRLELKDAQDGIRFTRFDIGAKAPMQTYCWDFRNRNAYRTVSGRPDLDIHQSKELVFIIERENSADKISNPKQGTIAF